MIPVLRLARYLNARLFMSVRSQGFILQKSEKKPSMSPDEAEEELLTYDDLISSRCFLPLVFYHVADKHTAFLSRAIINPLLFNRYEEFHPFLFCQHEKSCCVEFESFNKVCAGSHTLLMA